MRYIGRDAFKETKVSFIKLPEGLEYLGGAFNGCKSLRSVEFPQSLKRIDDFAFSGCDSLFFETGKLVFPRNLEVIGYAAFRSCFSLKHVVLPASVDSVKGCAFYGLRGLRIDCYALTPPKKGVDIISEHNYYGELYVPAKKICDIHCERSV